MGRGVGATLTHKNTLVIEQVLKDNSVKEIAKILGWSTAAVAEHLEKPIVKTEINRLRTLPLLELVEGVALGHNLMKQAERLDKLARGAKGDAQKLNATKELIKFIEKYAERRNIDLTKYVEVGAKKFAMMTVGYEATIETKKRLDDGEDIREILNLANNG